MHPAVHATTRTPGPSTVDPVVNECRNPMSPVASARPDVGLGNVLAQIDAQLERALRLEGRLRGRGRVRHGGLLAATSSPWP